ncbi:MAG: hypothetical protein IJU23_08310 [Proteobacteria bacterium]|nr:hypothetical protein [Pseudomonadota bacterium]
MHKKLALWRVFLCNKKGKLWRKSGKRSVFIAGIAGRFEEQNKRAKNSLKMEYEHEAQMAAGGVNGVTDYGM